MNNENFINSPHLLNSEHQVNHFSCAYLPLDQYLKKYALQNIQNSSARTYVMTRNSKVIGYYTLTYGSIAHASTPPRIRKGLGKYPIPIIISARLAVDIQEQKIGIGKALLKDALLRTIKASEIAGLRAVLVHAKDGIAKAFYKKYGFEESPIDELHLYLLLKDLKKTLNLT